MQSTSDQAGINLFHFAAPGVEARFAIPPERVEVVSTALTVTPAPLTPPAISGVALWNNQLVTVINLACLMDRDPAGQEPAGRGHDTYLIVRVAHAQGYELLALPILPGAGIREVPAELPLDTTYDGPMASFIYAACHADSSSLLLLDVDQMLQRLVNPQNPL